MKKLNKLGLSQFECKRIMSVYDLEEVDEIIDQINKLKETDAFKKLEKACRRLVNFVREMQNN
ncbi:hypothetical protein FDC22_06175 [Clostridium botulinum]|uniref:Uncharacterized protein n=1 Tax=Clostridium botulinum (strain Okra / Type B1) TaxID=498213 RepID=B1IJ42_CLOBK|nr:hypothetical protein [Clostridium botulinum]ACA43954.1 hypothetical protein CLD_2037 [Clostridium botulinum B1 str. Okra]MBD5564450.1 hypothetical protein [Clostridium botulinum]MBD5566968.1 hypothetical protein [Clostridium botulinum]MBD5570419.1 hypothetical protein [Clostridium botulinum]MBD5577785.1 hypothetical protein [Clostridium botulinum]